ncbi:flagellin N-terminal-like domain-containing protein [Natronoarchaeum philippinense]|uniref:Flagellin N-terminal-like domain-containing protein n=1 Tax=Natronoarchaeum philippinense TaxID=558529 RepID=A0A285N3J3_NATPI|nr:type IV pilin N-terminal domain-containing protein [Natronoarchaeum philippinense]SNZ03999.1 flagellin N-terminal-like domain-containing protein [Natronoarchaeum philippinense]
MSRASAPVVGAVLLIAVTVTAAGLVAFVAFEEVEEPPPPTPQNAEVTGALVEPADSPQACGGDSIRLVHQGGNAVELSRTYILVRPLDGPASEARIENLPTDGTTFEDEQIAYDPDNLINDNCVRGVAAENRGQWTAGTRIQFDLNSGAGTLDAGDRIEVVVVHEPSGGVVAEVQLTMRDQ